MEPDVALDGLAVLALAAGEQGEGREGVEDLVAEGPVLLLVLDENLVEPLEHLLGAVAFEREGLGVGVDLLRELQLHRLALAVPLDLQLQDVLLGLERAVQGVGKVLDGPLGPEDLHAVAVAVGRLEVEAAGAHDVVSDADLSVRGAVLEDVPHHQMGGLLFHELHSDARDPEVVEPPLNLGVRTLAGLILPGTAVREVVHLGGRDSGGEGGESGAEQELLDHGEGGRSGPRSDRSQGARVVTPGCP